MEKKASEVQKERIKELEQKANDLLDQCEIVTLASVNESGYPRICTIQKIMAKTFRDIYFFTSKRSHLNGKATHFQANPKASVCYSLHSNSVTLIGEIEIIEDISIKQEFDKYCDRNFFKQGVVDPKCLLLKFHTIEATFWIDGKFRTCKYK